MSYIFKERNTFTTLGELRNLTKSLGDDTIVTICGASEPGFFHIREDRKLITLDYNDLDEWYDYTLEEYYEVMGHEYMDF